MSYTLFKANIKNNRFIWILMAAIYTFYYSIMLTMFDPESAEGLMAMMDAMPKELIDALGFNFGTTLLTFISGTLYSMLLFMFPMILTIVVNHRLIASQVDKGSMAYLISTSNSRKKIATTQALFSIISITTLFVYITIIALILSSTMFPGQLEIGKFLLLNLYALLLYYAINSICFFASCFANETRHSLGLGAGIPIGFVILQMLGDSGEQLNWIGNLSLYALFNPERLFAGDAFAYVGMFVFAIIATVLYVSGIIIFDKKDLPI
ncbi:ABC-2 type transport system permease protein [Natranaerovirga pectinivora]|uniref:ABC-2 type transport system permease protein n=1 Tax=Natranaerovirga pectinivora TaxID=682400 RepID=A0A4R3MSX9_9FIRM|nr:ABC transporter permease subunit [Natranaerovirga pectinivora]TCT16144.1 ABC-2 type transport system permease protein [Natranaerovirga pectinivora]